MSHIVQTGRRVQSLYSFSMSPLIYLQTPHNKSFSSETFTTHPVLPKLSFIVLHTVSLQSPSIRQEGLAEITNESIVAIFS